MYRVSFVVALVLASSLAAVPARAAPGYDTTLSVQELIDEAAERFRSKDFAGALERYERAYDLSHEHMLLFMIGRCHQKLGRDEPARKAFEAFLAGEDVPESARSRAAEALRALAPGPEPDVTVLEIVVAPPGARVFVDGAFVGLAPVGAVAVKPGGHRVRATAPGHDALERMVEVHVGTTVPVRLELPVAPDRPLSRSERPSYSPWTWMTLGVGLALLAGSGVAYGLGERDHQAITGTSNYGTSQPTTMTRRRALDLEESGDAKKLAGHVLVGIGSAAIVTSTVLLVLEATTHAPPSAISVGVAPDAGGGLFAVQGSF